MNTKESVWPEEFELSIIETTNAMDSMFKELSPAADEFINYARRAELPLLDVGAAYGVIATIAALDNGAEVIACDQNEERLSILHDSIKVPLKSKLKTTVSTFPYGLNLRAQSVSGILVSNVLNFMDGDTIIDSLHSCWRWLIPGGKLFITVMTPQLYPQLIPEYEDRLKMGVKWPGVFHLKSIVSEKWRGDLPNVVHLFELNELQKLVETAHFAVDSVEFFCYKNYPPEHQYNGKEFISLSATKLPLNGQEI